MENMLRPMLESLGYVVTSGGETQECDLVIVGDDREAPANLRGDVIRIRSRPEAAGRKDDSIYRYDRAGLLMALKTAGSAK